MKDPAFIDNNTNQGLISKHEGGESLFKKDDFPEPGIITVHQPLQEDAPDKFKGDLNKVVSWQFKISIHACTKLLNFVL